MLPITDSLTLKITNPELIGTDFSIVTVVILLIVKKTPIMTEVIEKAN